MSPQESSRWSIMSVAIDANSRAPPHTTTTSVSQQTYSTTYQTSPGNHSRESLAQSHVSFRSGAESSSNLLHHSPHSSVYQRDVSSERRMWQESQRPALEKFSTELRSKLRKVRQNILRESPEAVETRHLLASCRTSPLASKVQKARKSCVQKQRSAFLASSAAAKEKEKEREREEKEKEASTPPTPSTPASSFPSLPGLSTSPSSLDSTPPDSRKGSITSIISAFSLSPPRSSTTTLDDTPSSPSTPLRQRKISLPLEYDPNFHPRQLSVSLEHRNTSEGGAPVFRMPKWTPPSQDDCRACEIIRIVADSIREEGGADGGDGDEGQEVRGTKVLRRLSDEKGNLFIEQVRERDERGRKRVLLSWGEDVDVVIPPPQGEVSGGDESGDGENTRKSRLGWRLGERYKALCEIMKRVFREEGGTSGEADWPWEVYP